MASSGTITSSTPTPWLRQVKKSSVATLALPACHDQPAAVVDARLLRAGQVVGSVIDVIATIPDVVLLEDVLQERITHPGHATADRDVQRAADQDNDGDARQPVGGFELAGELFVLGLQRDLVEQLEPLRGGCGAGRQIKAARIGIKVAQGTIVRKLHIDPALAQSLGCGNERVFSVACGGYEMFGCPVHRIHVIVAIMKEVAHLFPGQSAPARILTGKCFIDNLQPFTGPAVSSVEGHKLIRQSGLLFGDTRQLVHG